MSANNSSLLTLAGMASLLRVAAATAATWLPPDSLDFQPAKPVKRRPFSCISMGAPWRAVAGDRLVKVFFACIFNGLHAFSMLSQIPPMRCLDQKKALSGLL